MSYRLLMRIITEPNTDTTLNDAEPGTEKTEVAGENDFPAMNLNRG